MTSVRVAVVFHSGYGHTKVVAEAVARGAKEAKADVNVIQVDKHGQISPEEWQTLDDADAIIFGAPTYMGSLSGSYKMFMDATSKPWMGQKWKDKIAGGFTNSMGMSGDKLSSMQQLVVLAGQHGMIWVSLGELGAPSSAPHQRDPNAINRVASYLGVMAQSDNDSPEKTPPLGDIKTAEGYGARVANAAQRWFR